MTEAPETQEEEYYGIRERLLHRVPRRLRAPLDWLISILFAVLFIMVLRLWVVAPYRIPSASMEPTLHCAHRISDDGCLSNISDRIIASPIVYRFRSPHRGDLVVFHSPARAKVECNHGGIFVKRIVGLPGESVQERDNRIYINGRLLAEPYLKIAPRDDINDVWKVPSGHYFLLGDNRTSSCDSRYWGSVRRGAMIGPVVITYWPLNRLAMR